MVYDYPSWGYSGPQMRDIGLFGHISTDCILRQEKSAGLRVQNFRFSPVSCVEKAPIAREASMVLTENRPMRSGKIGCQDQCDDQLAARVEKLCQTELAHRVSSQPVLTCSGPLTTTCVQLRAA
jgi:hypothetical protein